IMSGILSIPIGVLIASVVLMLSNPMVREVVATNGEATYQLAMSLGGIFANLLPIIVFVVALAAGLRFLPDLMIKGFIGFGRGMGALIKLVLVFSIVEYFTGVFTIVLGGWRFGPIIAAAEDQPPALATAGYIGTMLAGALPMVYVLRKYLGGPPEALGSKVRRGPRLLAVGTQGAATGTAGSSRRHHRKWRIPWLRAARRASADFERSRPGLTSSATDAAGGARPHRQHGVRPAPAKTARALP